MNNVAMNNSCINYCVDMFSFMSVNGIVGSYGNSMFNHLRNCQTLFAKPAIAFTFLTVYEFQFL